MLLQLPGDPGTESTVDAGDVGDVINIAEVCWWWVLLANSGLICWWRFAKIAAAVNALADVGCDPFVELILDLSNVDRSSFDGDDEDADDADDDETLIFDRDESDMIWLVLVRFDDDDTDRSPSLDFFRWFDSFNPLLASLLDPGKKSLGFRLISVMRIQNIQLIRFGIWVGAKL